MPRSARVYARPTHPQQSSTCHDVVHDLFGGGERTAQWTTLKENLQLRWCDGRRGWLAGPHSGFPSLDFGEGTQSWSFTPRGVIIPITPSRGPRDKSEGPPFPFQRGTLLLTQCPDGHLDGDVPRHHTLTMDHPPYQESDTAARGRLHYTGPVGDRTAQKNARRKGKKRVWCTLIN